MEEGARVGLAFRDLIAGIEENLNVDCHVQKVAATSVTRNVQGLVLDHPLHGALPG